MNFGDILDKWEKGQGRADRKDQLDTWLNENEVYDKDENDDGRNHKNRRRDFSRSAADGVLDIHGLTSEKAWLALQNFFDSAKEQELKKLRIIHGKGNHSQGDAVLRSTVREFIEKCPFAGKSGFEKAVNGGSGATWVLLKSPT